jgi:predicted PurR-regulated permease PerM
MPSDPRPAEVVLPQGLISTLKALTVTLAVLALYFGRDILIPLCMAAFLAFILDPWVKRLTRWRLPHGLAVVVVTGTLAASLTGGVLVLGGQLAELAKDAPQYQSHIEHKLRALRGDIRSSGSFRSIGQLLAVIEKEVAATTDSVGSVAHASTDRMPPGVTVITDEQAASSSPSRFFSRFMPWIDPLITAGISLVLVVFILMDRHDLRDRLLRLGNTDLYRMTDALNEAAERLNRYLTAQVCLNLGYGMVQGVMLSLIGVPGAVIWGVLAGVMRFVPYVGPIMAAVFPLLMAFGADAGWTMLLHVMLLIALMELITNNLLEPWLYGSSTGMGSIAVLLSATFWTALWGPAGLVLATPISVCLASLGRHIPKLGFLDVLLGSAPALPPAMRLHQRLLAEDVDDAVRLSAMHISQHGIDRFYDDVALPALTDRRRLGDEHRDAHHRITAQATMGRVLTRLGAPPAGTPTSEPMTVTCVGLRRDNETLAARMLAHMLQERGISAQATSLFQLTTQVNITSPGAHRQHRPDDASAHHAGHHAVLCLIVDTSVPANMLHALLQRVRRSHPQATLQVCALPREGQTLPADLLGHLAGVDLITHELTAASQALEACVHPPASPESAESTHEPQTLHQPAVS